MSDFDVSLNGIKSAGSTLEGLARTMDRYDDSIRHARNRLYGPQWGTVRSVLQRIEGMVQQESRSMRRCGQTLKEIARSYETTEKTLTGQANTAAAAIERLVNRITAAVKKFVNKLRKWVQSVIEYYRNRPDSHTVEPYEVDNIVFDKNYQKGRYGGNQGSLRYNADAEKKQWIYEHILKKNNPDLDLDSTQLDEFYSKMNQTGCAYVALLNTIFVHFQGREAEFEKTFGYPMYDKNGNLNYDALFADIYTTKYNDGKTFEGLYPKEGEELIEGFLKDRGVNCDAKITSDVSPKNIDTLLYDGKQVIIHYYDGNIYPVDGGDPHSISAHDMVITGVTEDGKYIVSSWGKKYYLDPKEVVTREHTNDKGKTYKSKTSLNYTIVTYR